MGYQIFAFIPTHLYQIISDFPEPTHPPNRRISYVEGIDDKVLVDMQYRLLCSPKPKNSFLTPDHDILTILASYHQLFSFSTPNPPKKWHVTYGWPRFEMIMV